MARASVHAEQHIACIVSAGLRTGGGGGDVDAHASLVFDLQPADLSAVKPGKCGPSRCGA